MHRILVTGANGQIGSELVPLLQARHGTENVISSDLRAPSRNGVEGVFETLDVRDAEVLAAIVDRHRIDTIYHLASLLSARGEQQPDLAWGVNMDGLRNVLELARHGSLRVFWPSSIAVFGPATPRRSAPQATILDPNTVYGITKVSGELLCRYYHEKFGVDVRSVRYPGLISYKTPPGGGTTDYAVEIFYAAVAGRPYTCFVRSDTRLPMMYMHDALHAALNLMEADSERISIRTSYNIGALSFSAQELADEIRRHVPDFECRFEPDFRQTIADAWPADVDDSIARSDWDWTSEFTLSRLVDDMLIHLREKRPAER